MPAARKDLLLAVAQGLASISRSHTVDRTVAGQSYPVHILEHGGKICLEPKVGDDHAAMEIMVDGIIRNADNVLDDLTAELQGGNLGIRALRTKKAEAQALEQSIALWENAASVSLDLLRNRVEELRAAIGTAELAAEAAKLAKEMANG